MQKFRIRTWKACGTYRNSGYGYGSLTDLTEVPGMGMEVLQNSQNFRVGIRMLYPYLYPHLVIFKRDTRIPGIVPRAYRTCRSSGMHVVQNLQNFRVRVIPRVWLRAYPTEHNLFTYRSARYGYGSRAELTEVPGRYRNVVTAPVPAPGVFF